MNQKIMFSDEQVALLQAAGYLGDHGVFDHVGDGVYEMLDMNPLNADEIMRKVNDLPWQVGQAAVGGCPKCNRIFALEMVADLGHATLTERLHDAAKLMKWLEGGEG